MQQKLCKQNSLQLILYGEEVRKIDEHSGKRRNIEGGNELIGLWRRVAGCASDCPRLPAAVILSFPSVVPIESRKNASKQDNALTSLIVLENIYRIRCRRARTARKLDFLKSFRIACPSPYKFSAFPATFL